ncbi:MAG TPA: prolipoprotein diacylglyceryl transferase [Candidatus Rifleibacterium sp.]|nr:prolipoprotein diacylglyceryl transferase [Candidatus Rifleibacterium sp.]
MYPILLSTPWFNVYTYGLLIAAGYSIGTLLILREAGRAGLNREAIFDMLIIQMIVGILGSRLLFIIEYTPEKLTFSDFFAFEQGGLTFYGSVISSFIFDLLYLKARRIPFWPVMDCIGFGLPAGIALARLGCFFNGCCYGTVCTYPWGVPFEHAGPGLHHPTQIYESLSALLILAIIQYLRRFRRNHGEVFLACMALYGFFRFFIEFFRAENPEVLAGLKLSQLIGIGAIAASFAAWKIIDRSRKFRLMPDKEPVSLRPEP